MPKYVYLLTCPTRYKIGFSQHPRARRSAIRTETGLDLKLEAMIVGRRKLEGAVLNFFDRYRIEGEWFQPEQEIVTWFKQHRYFIDPGPPYYPNDKLERYGKEAWDLWGDTLMTPKERAKVTRALSEYGRVH